MGGRRLDSLPVNPGTPAHPEYPSAHSSMSGAAAFILAAAFGENTAFSVTSEIRPGTRSFASFSDATAEIVNARVFGGIHFRTSCLRADGLGRVVADYVRAATTETTIETSLHRLGCSSGMTVLVFATLGDPSGRLRGVDFGFNIEDVPARGYLKGQAQRQAFGLVGDGEVDGGVLCHT